MKRLTILVDCDDVMNNLCDAWVAELNDLYGTSVSPEDIKEWDLCSAFKTLSKNKILLPLYWESFWESVTPKEGAAEGIQRLLHDGHEVIVLTDSSINTIVPKSRLMLFKHFPFLSQKDLIITSRKDLVRGDVLIDDAPHNFAGCNRKLGILFSAMHNRSFDADKHGLVRADNWDQVYDEILKLSKSQTEV